MTDNTERPAVRILVMDDDQMLLATARLMLARLDYGVALATDGSEAIQIYRDALASEAPVRVAILDLRVPGGMGALEAAEEILKLDPQACLVLASGSTSEPAMLDFRDHGFAAVISKPFVLADLGLLLGELID
jgi:two-component system cell cycle sensor histidine kinase/response regulator CckA